MSSTKRPLLPCFACSSRCPLTSPAIECSDTMAHRQVSIRLSISELRLFGDSRPDRRRSGDAEENRLQPFELDLDGAACERVSASPGSRYVEELQPAEPHRQRGHDQKLFADRLHSEHRP